MVTDGAQPFSTAWARTAPARILRRTMHRTVLTPYMWVCARPRVEGRENLESLSGPAVFVANHASHLDTPLILGALPGSIASRLAVGAAADYFFTSAVTGVSTALLFNAFPVQRSGSRRGGRDGAKILLDEGWSVLLFPEGTRSADGTLGAFKTGAARLCLEAGVPAVPVGLCGTYSVIPRGRRIPVQDGTRVRVRFGQPIIPAVGETSHELRDRMRQRVNELAVDSTLAR
ncbi:lysophospholipid acyltransferase family protein [Streptomyces sp. S584]|uniref:lysophospholipid acyltransferase family protein n=1 Tax=Streptomyces sp. S584 TaxID=3096010 RepID=UPI002B003C77|nr:lysophospholipid acyltransferase family protein [Streptomyces sp. S584]